MSNLEALVAKKAARDGKMYRNKEIAEAVKMSEATVSRLMRGQNIEGMTVRALMRLCDWLDCDIQELIYTNRHSLKAE